MSGRAATVAVVGAGLGGLAAAIRCAAAGHRVTVFEAADTPGGKAGEAHVGDFAFDTGPSLITMPDVLDDLFAAAGTTAAAAGVVLRPLNPAFVYHDADGTTLVLPPGARPALEAVNHTLGAAAHAEMERFLAYAAGIWNAAAPAFVYGAAPTPGRLLGLGPRVWAGVANIDAMRTMKAAIDAYVRTPLLRRLLYRFATYNGSDYRRAPATLNCIAHVEIAGGGLGVEGGVYAVVRALERTARATGVEIVTGARVTRIQTNRRRVVHTTAGAFACDAVVCNADPAHTAGDLLVDAPKAVTPAEPPSMSGLCMVFRAARRPDRPAHTVWFPADYEAEFRWVFDGDRPPRVPAVYVCAQGAAHGRGDARHEPLFVMVNAPPEPAGGRSDDGVYAALADRVEATLRANGTLAPDDTRVWLRTPAQLAERFAGSRGAIYGGSSNSMFAAFARPPNRVAGAPGVYLACGGAHPGGGVPMVLLSGRAAAAALMDDFTRGRLT